MATALPQVQITPGPAGWLVSCTNVPGCDYESFHPRRPGADRAAHEHRAKHAPKGGDRC